MVLWIRRWFLWRRGGSGDGGHRAREEEGGGAVGKDGSLRVVLQLRVAIEEIGRQA